MTSPLITIVTPVLNGAQFLEATILSVLSLASEATEHIIIDGGSTDGTRELVARYEGLSLRWVSAPDRGIYDAMNRGWSIANGASYVLFLGAGDRIIALPKVLANPQDGEVIYGVVNMGEQRWFKPTVDWRLNLYNGLHHQALLVPKVLHPASPFDLSFPRYADFDFNQRLKKDGVRFRFDPEFRAYALPGGVSDHSSILESARVVRKNHGPFWCMGAMLGYAALRCFPPLRRYTSIFECKAIGLA